MVDFFNIEAVRLRSARVQRNNQTVDDCPYNGGANFAKTARKRGILINCVESGDVLASGRC